MKRKTVSAASALAGAIACSLVCAFASTASAAPTGKTLATAEKAVDALVGALRPYNPKALLSLFGKGSEPLFESEDAVADQNLRNGFLELYDTKHELVPQSDGITTLVVGATAWPFPIPLVKVSKGWAFDTASGMDEIINRRIGSNELQTIQTCLTFVDAEREYYLRDRDGDGILEYAQAFRSSLGLHNGLFWPASPDEPQSPLGELMAIAAAEGYTPPVAAFHGYHYRMLNSQGPAAPGGAYDYLAGSNQIGGFAMIASPAPYGVSGIMTFIVNQDGVVYQRDLGAQTDAAVAAIMSFDPAAGWTRVPDKDLAPFPED